MKKLPFLLLNTLLVSGLLAIQSVQANETAEPTAKTEVQQEAPITQQSDKQAPVKAEKIDLKRVMKKMRFHYSQAARTPSADEFNRHVGEFKTLLSSSLRYNYAKEKRNTSMEGLKKVETLVNSLPEATTDNLFELQKQWREVDQLRVDYHKKVKPSIWDLIFG